MRVGVNIRLVGAQTKPPAHLPERSHTVCLAVLGFRSETLPHITRAPLNDNLKACVTAGYPTTPDIQTSAHGENAEITLLETLVYYINI